MACRFLWADDPRVTERFGVHASFLPAGLSELETECFSRFVIALVAVCLCRPWDLGCQLSLLAGVGSSPSADAELPAQLLGAMARRVSAAPLLRHLGLAAAPAAGPGPAPEPFQAVTPGALATTSKARPIEPARHSSTPACSPSSSRPY